MRTGLRSRRRGGSRTRPGTAPAPATRTVRSRSRSRSSSHPQLRTRAPEQVVLCISARILEDVVKKVAEHAPELGPGAKAERDQVVPVDGEVGQSMRLPALALEQLAKALEPLEILH